MATIKVSELVEDFDVYPRFDGVNELHVQRLAEALRAGQKLPPVVACAKSKKLVDGFHRRRAYVVVYGDDAMIPVELRKYKNDGELFADAIFLNTGHGRPIPLADTKAIVNRARAFGLNDLAITKALRLTTKTLNVLTVDPMMKAAPLSVPRANPSPASNGHAVHSRPTSAPSDSPSHCGLGDTIFKIQRLANEMCELPRNERLDRELLLLMNAIAKRFTNDEQPVASAHALVNEVDIVLYSARAEESRLKAAKLICLEGCQTSEQIAIRCGIARDDVELVLDHDWFDCSVKGWHITPDGQQAVGE